MKFLRETGLISLKVQQDSSLRPLSIEKTTDSVKIQSSENKQEIELIPLKVQQDSSLRPLSVERTIDSVKTRLIEGNKTSESSESSEIYKGEYTIIPRVEDQTLETKNKLLKENVLVTAIPYFEVSNIADGITVYIGE